MESTLTFWADPRVDRIADKLRPYCKRSHVQVKVVADNAPNAFTFFGANIYICTGIVQYLGDDDDALAFVIAHEMGHAQLFHVSEYFAKKLVSDWVGRSLTKSDQDGLRGLLSQITSAAFTRPQETASDEAAIKIMSQGGFDTQGAVRALHALSNLHPGGTTILDTHPAPLERANHLARLIASTSRSGSVASSSGNGSAESRTPSHTGEVGAKGLIGAGWRELSSTEVRAEVEKSTSVFGGSVPADANLRIYKSSALGDALAFIFEIDGPSGAESPTGAQFAQTLQNACQQVRSAASGRSIAFEEIEPASATSLTGASGASASIYLGSGIERHYEKWVLGAIPGRAGKVFFLGCAGPAAHQAKIATALQNLIQGLRN